MVLTFLKFGIPALLVIAVIAYFKLRQKSKEMKAKGIVLDFWNKWSGLLATAGGFLVVAWLGADESEWNSVFGDLGSVVQAVDGLVGVTAGIFLAVRGWVESKRAK